MTAGVSDPQGPPDEGGEVMGKVTKIWDAPPQQEVSGPYSILTGANLIKPKPPRKPEKEQKDG
jgi:hypothetical protein